MVLTSVAVDWERFENDVTYGELYAVNADGKKVNPKTKKVKEKVVKRGLDLVKEELGWH